MALRTRFLSWVTLLAVGGLLACGNGRGGFSDGGPDVATVDVPVDNGPLDVVAPDTGPPVDGTVCVAATCTATCQGLGYVSGSCTSGLCACAGVPANDAGTSDATSTVITCASNGDCPATQFCSGPGCDGMGFCYPRGTLDPTTCGTVGPSECGCDGMWYANSCTRLADGIRLNDAPTACGPAPDGGP